MSKPSLLKSSKRGRFKALPWAVLLQGGFVIAKRWRALSEKDRARLSSLVRESGGRPDKLDSKQRKELRRLVGKLDLKGMGGELISLTRGRGWRKRR